LALAAIPIAALPPQPGIAEAPSPPAPVSASTAAIPTQPAEQPLTHATASAGAGGLRVLGGRCCR